MTTYEWQRTRTDEDEDTAYYPGFTLGDLHGLRPQLEIRMREIEVLKKCSTRFWILHCIKRECEISGIIQYKALILMSKDDRNESLILVRKYELETRIILQRKAEKGEVIYVKVDHVDPFYDRLILRDVTTQRPTGIDEVKKAYKK